MKKKNNIIENEPEEICREDFDILFNQRSKKEKNNVKSTIQNIVSIPNIVSNLEHLSQDELSKINDMINRKRNFDYIDIDINSLDDLKKEYAKIKKNKNNSSKHLLLDNDLQDLCKHMANELNISCSQLTNYSYILFYSFIKKRKALKK